ncbi:hypothetical protein N8H22_11195 [Stutzerimonas stutzeri]|uniref:hypothetical protein n=1 Tax=Stutzerimonas sp. S1 TaxID=3030652 RepID=UPI0022244F54|nr:hypothetical protein [Stutzerimonas sp. S1]MCW3149160.1 hypothetical protein [Stutzerimonas sp. S1]
MNTLKQNILIACGLAAALQLTAVQAQQNQHDGHHPEKTPTSSQANQAKQQRGAAKQGIDQGNMQMHDEHMGKGQMMDRDNMGQSMQHRDVNQGQDMEHRNVNQGQGMEHRNVENSQRDKKPSKGNAKDKPRDR